MKLTENVLVAGRYQLVSCLGAGAMGEVWRAQDTRFETRSVAVKFLREDETLKEDQLNRDRLTIRLEQHAARGTLSFETALGSVVAALGTANPEGVRTKLTNAIGKVSAIRPPDVIAVFDELVHDPTLNDNARMRAKLRRLFRDEANAVANLRHDNIVSIFDYGDHEGSPYLVMDYIEGRTLYQVIQEHQKLPHSRRLQLIEDLCAGLGYAHRHKLVHRDIKPANLIIDGSTGSLKILDFGVVRRLGSASTVGVPVGTFCYMSPEQTKGAATLDHRSDIFAVGLVFYELMVGKKAYPPGKSIGDLVARIQRDPPPEMLKLDTSIPTSVQDIIDKAIQKLPDNRYPDLSIMERDIRRLRMKLQAEEQADITAVTVGDDKTIIKPRPQSDAAELLASAQRAFDGGDDNVASEMARRVLALTPGEESATALLSRIEARKLEARVRDMLQPAEKFLALEELTSARGALAAAENLHPSSPAIAAFKAKLDAAVAARGVSREKLQQEREQREQDQRALQERAREQERVEREQRLREERAREQARLEREQRAREERAREQARLAAEQRAREEQERLAKEKSEREQREREEQERLAREQKAKEERERQEREQRERDERAREQERLAREQKAKEERERQQREQREREERAREQERLAREQKAREERERQEREQREREERIREQERLAREQKAKQERERQEREQREREERAQQERLAAEQKAKEERERQEQRLRELARGGESTDDQPTDATIHLSQEALRVPLTTPPGLSKPRIPVAPPMSRTAAPVPGPPPVAPPTPAPTAAPPPSGPRTARPSGKSKRYTAKPAPTKPEPPSGLPQAPARASQSSGSRSAAGAVTPSPMATARTGVSPQTLAIAVIVILLLMAAIAGLVWMRSQGSEPRAQPEAQAQPATNPDPPATSPPPATSSVEPSTAPTVVETPPVDPPPPPMMSTVYIDLRPWARVKIVPGTPNPAISTDTFYAPFAIDLPPGDYNLEAENGGVTRATTFQLKVAEGGPQTFVRNMPGFNATKIVEGLLGQD